MILRSNATGVKSDRLLDTRPARHRVIHTCDVYVQPDGLMYITDFNAGLYILRRKGA